MSSETRGPPHRERHLDLVLDAAPAVLSSMRAHVTHWLREHHWPDRRIAEMVVAVNEAVSNSVLHAYADGGGGRVALTAEVLVPFPGLGTATFVVRDRGRWRRPQRAEPGFGLALVRDLMDEVTVDTGAAGTTVRMSSPVVALRSS
jgi:anti-sigma regulatory factor (Ser/Thr protein kinase)